MIICVFYKSGSIWKVLTTADTVMYLAVGLVAYAVILIKVDVVYAPVLR